MFTMKSVCRVSRKVHFSSAHNMAVKGWSDEKNRAVFGDLYSPHGYGHNYTLEATVEGPIHPESGMIINLKILDQMMKDVTNQLDHRYLNLDVPEFETTLPSVENVGFYCWEKLRPSVQSLGLKLSRLRLYEREDYWVDIADGEMT